MTCSFRTIEFRSTCWYSQKRPSATVNTGLSRISPSAYSPIRKVVACQLVRWRASRWTNPCSSDLAVRAAGLARTTVRNESTTTTPGLAASTSLTISVEDRVQVLSSTTWLRLTNRTAVFDLGRVEEAELLLVAEHLEGRLAQHGEVQGRPLRGGVGEHHLVGERRLPAPGAPAMMLNEYSGSPPPRISSRPGTPVGSSFRLIRSLALMVPAPHRNPTGVR